MQKLLEHKNTEKNGMIHNKDKIKRIKYKYKLIKQMKMMIMMMSLKNVLWQKNKKLKKKRKAGKIIVLNQPRIGKAIYCQK